MFERIKTFEEERRMTFITAMAVEVPIEEVSLRIKSADNCPLPTFLKRIKKESSGRVLMLKKIENNCFKNDDFIEVKIPEFEPITAEQFEDAKKEWPCYFYNHKENPVDQKWAKIKADQLKADGSDHYCAGTCRIYDGDSLLASSADTEPIVGHSVTNCIRSVSQSEYGYLCTGFTAFLYREPCTSCAMALVHGRIQKVFILHPGNEFPFSKLKLNYNKDINHRFNVYFLV